MLITVCLAFLSFCHSPTESDNHITPNPISFADLQVGQSSTYLLFVIDEYWNPESTIEYVRDTLIVTITAEQDDGFLVTESFIVADTSDGSYGNDTATYLLKIIDDTLQYLQLTPSQAHSRLFIDWSLTLPGLPLAPDTGVQVTMDGWRPVFPSAECYHGCLGYLDHFEALGHSYNGLNVFLIDVTAVDGPHLCYIFSRQTGLVRVYALNPWIGTGQGWDLLP